MKTRQKILKILRGSKEPIGLHEIYDALDGKVSDSNLCHHLNRLEVEKKIKSSMDIKHNKKYDIINPLESILADHIIGYDGFNEKEFFATAFESKLKITKEDWYQFWDNSMNEVKSCKQ